MTPLWPTVVAAVAGYLAGSLPFGYWVVRVGKRVDVRTVGSGNIGATNVWRTFGRWYGVPVVLLDVAKGFVPALVATLTISHVAGICAGAAAMLGHWRPLFLKFEQGGKMVATCGGAFFGVAPLVAVIGGVVWIAAFAATRYASVASIAAAVALPVAAFAIGEPWSVRIFAAAACLAVIFLHRTNLRRLREGTESRFQLRRRGSRRATPRATS